MSPHYKYCALPSAFPSLFLPFPQTRVCLSALETFGRIPEGPSMKLGLHTLPSTTMSPLRLFVWPSLHGCRLLRLAFSFVGRLLRVTRCIQPRTLLGLPAAFAVCWHGCAYGWGLTSSVFHGKRRTHLTLLACAFGTTLLCLAFERVLVVDGWTHCLPSGRRWL